jgi:hypothetical protein
MSQGYERPGARGNEHAGQNKQSLWGDCTPPSARCTARQGRPTLANRTRSRKLLLELTSTPLGKAAEAGEPAAAPWVARKFATGQGPLLALTETIAEMTGHHLPSEVRHG